MEEVDSCFNLNLWRREWIRHGPKNKRLLCQPKEEGEEEIKPTTNRVNKQLAKNLCQNWEKKLPKDFYPKMSVWGPCDDSCQTWED